MKIQPLIFLMLVTLNGVAYGQVQVNGFGHIEYELYYLDKKDEYESEFKLGEHDLFVNGRLNKKLTFLSEMVVREDKNTATGFGVGIERAFMKFNYKGGHSLQFGKMHTALNYWNDVFHHGRIFFPTIDRPLNFDYFMPIHTLGLRATGQNFGNLGFGYDIQIGNSMQSTDFGSEGVNFSYLASLHIKPSDGSRLMLGYYRDYLPNNHIGAHSHSGTYHNDDYHGSLTMDQFCFSYARFYRKLEILNEFAYINTTTDSLGKAGNISNYTYVGYKIKGNYIPFVMMDYLHVAANDLHTQRIAGLKYALGFRWEFDPKCNLKIQLERYGPVKGIDNVPGMARKLEIKFQLAYAI